MAGLPNLQGWWLASDGKWYPPELKPASEPESPPDDGWWIASDGKWYPPELHPSVRETLPPTVGSAASQGAVATMTLAPPSVVTSERAIAAAPTVVEPAAVAAPTPAYTPAPSAYTPAPSAYTPALGFSASFDTPQTSALPQSSFFTSTSADLTFTSSCRPRRGGIRRRGVMATSAAGIAMLVVFGALVLPGIIGSASALSAVELAVHTTTAASSVHVDLQSNITVNGTGVDISASGPINFAAKAFDFNVSITGRDGNQYSAELREVDKALYLHIPNIPLGGKPWVELGLDSSSDAAGAAPQHHFSLSQVMGLITGHGGHITSLGTQEVNGAQSQGYDIYLDSASLQSVFDSISLPSALTSSDLQEIAQVKKALGGVTADIKVWIDGDNHLRRLDVTANGAVSGTTFNGHVVLDLSQYGAPADVFAPPSDQVTNFDQAFGGASTGQFDAGGPGSCDCPGDFGAGPSGPSGPSGSTGPGPSSSLT